MENVKIDDITVNRIISEFKEKYKHLDVLNDFQYENFEKFYHKYLTMEQKAGFMSTIVYEGSIIQNASNLTNKNVMFVKEATNKKILKKIFTNMKNDVTKPDSSKKESDSK